ncbi:MAG: dihydroorotate dehydrogenase electron transfer subunit [Spirochaetaceae bacterium]|nr:dihydroorotate dehydrogenase electron transfer subunit [Myxococcales bacterium]MCB9722618.1 dihydroorotate dehydrogenase electron transfer subunit [Spirochaetaceae bacterium]
MSATTTGIESRSAPLRTRARVISNEPDGRGRTLRLAVPGWPGAIPGQFLMLGPGAEAGVARRDPLLPRPMAVYRDLGVVSGAAEPSIEVLYRVVGRGTTLISEAQPGQSIPLVGPLGRGFPVAPGPGLALLVGGGTGIASLYELARALLRAGRPVLVLLGARSQDDLIGRRDFEALDLELVCATEDGSHGVAGRVTEPLAERLRRAVGEASGASRAGIEVFAVGPTPMMRACAGIAAELGVRCLVSLENPMACGFGVCLGCAAPRAEGGFSLVCRAGPVFDAREIAWEGLP